MSPGLLVPCTLCAEHFVQYVKHDRQCCKSVAFQKVSAMLNLVEIGMNLLHQFFAVGKRDDRVVFCGDNRPPACGPNHPVIVKRLLRECIQYRQFRQWFGKPGYQYDSADRLDGILPEQISQRSNAAQAVRHKIGIAVKIGNRGGQLIDPRIKIRLLRVWHR